MKKLDLEYYRQTLDWLDPDTGAMLVKSAVACLLDQKHRSGVAMSANFDSVVETFELIWLSTIDDAQRRSLPNDQELTQKGAECISLLLARELIGCDAFESAKKGTGFDYWLMPSNGFNFEAALEVSGIRKETNDNLVETRIKLKTKQIGKSPDIKVPKYISIVEFSSPKSSFVRRP